MKASDLIACFGKLGIQPPSRVMVHASLSGLGWVDGGAQTVVAALREAVGPEGAVIVPSFRNAIRAEYYALRECQQQCPQRLCSSRERGYTGVIGETVREQPDALRSCHPSFSWVGIGRDAEFLLEGHGGSPTPCGRGSPFFRLVERDGLVLLLGGIKVGGMTNMHAIEDIRNVPYLSAFDPVHRHSPYTTSGRRIQYVYPDLLQECFREAGLLRSVKTGASHSHVLSARAMASFLWVVTENDPWCLVLRPRGSSYDPFQDACAKVEAMIRAWKARRDDEAWRQFLEASHAVIDPVRFQPAPQPQTGCPAYRGFVRGYHRCAANDIPPWEKFEDYPRNEPGVATCDQCNWPARG